MNRTLKSATQPGNDNRAAVGVLDQGFKIDYYFPADDLGSVTPLTANIHGFIITTPDGTRYYFGINATETESGDDPSEITFPYSAHHEVVTDRAFSSWYLNKVVSADGMFTINLTYEAENYSYCSISMYHIPVNNLSDPDPSNDRPFDLVKNYIEGVRLSEL